jgi:TonB family protein
MRDPNEPRFDRRSPVQPGRSNAPYFIAAFFAAILIWTVQQNHIQDSNPRPVRDQAEGRSSARGNVRTLFSADDYPAEAQARGEEGTVRARLDIDTRGRVSKCSIIQSSGHASLDQATCSILQRRALFTPARDVDGKAVPDSVTTPSIVWRLES